jgi:hypothetical protein
LIKFIMKGKHNETTSMAAADVTFCNHSDI